MAYEKEKATHFLTHPLSHPLVVHEPSTGDPQPALPLTSDPQPTKRTTRSKLPKPAPKPSRQRRAKGSSRTGAPVAA